MSGDPAQENLVFPFVVECPLNERDAVGRGER